LPATGFNETEAWHSLAVAVIMAALAQAIIALNQFPLLHIALPLSVRPFWVRRLRAAFRKSKAYIQPIGRGGSPQGSGAGFASYRAGLLSAPNGGSLP
jgi:hypothetical protein